MLFLNSFFDEPVVAGYSLKAIFEYWWNGLIIILVLLVVAAGLYFVFAWLLGRMKFKEEDKEAFQRYKSAKGQDKKAIAKETKGPAKNVITVRRLSVWVIPVICVVAIVSAAAASFLPSAAFKNLMFTLGGSHVTIYDTAASREAAVL